MAAVFFFFYRTIECSLTYQASVGPAHLAHGFVLGLFCQRSGIIILMGGDIATISVRHPVFKPGQTFVKSTFNDQTGLINLDVFNVFTPVGPCLKSRSLNPLIPKLFGGRDVLRNFRKFVE